jgi:hypothetical protein
MVAPSTRLGSHPRARRFRLSAETLTRSFAANRPTLTVVELEPSERGVQVTMTVDAMHDQFGRSIFWPRAGTNSTISPHVFHAAKC